MRARNQPRPNPNHNGAARSAAPGKGDSADAPRGASATAPSALSSARTVARTLLFAFALLISVSRLLTGTLFFHYEMPEKGKLMSTVLYAVGLQRDIELTPSELALHDGRDPNKPVYVAILGDVFDVSAAKDKYRVGTSYAFFGGRDASRAYATGCFETHLTHDLRGLSESELAAIRHWHSFFSTSKRYFRVGKVKNPVLGDDDPIPAPCKDARDQMP